MNAKLQHFITIGIFYASKVSPLLDYVPTAGDSKYSTIAKCIKAGIDITKMFGKLTPNINTMIQAKSLKSYKMFPEMYELSVPIKETIFREKWSYFQEMRFDDTATVYFGGFCFTEDALKIPVTSYYESEEELNKFLDIFWKQYDNACSLSLLKPELKNPDLNEHCRIRPIGSTNQPIYGDTQKIIDSLIAETAYFKQDGLTRTWLFLGPPGLGKTRVASELARQTNGRLLRIDGANLNVMDIESIANFRPQLVLIDDIDQIANDILLVFLERMREMKVNMLLTSNSIEKMTEAILRPGRIDKIIEFKLPTAEDRKMVVLGFKNEFGLEVSEDQIQKLVELTDEMSHAYIREILIRLRHETFESVVDSIFIMKRLLLAIKKSGDKDKSDEKETVTV